MKIKPNEFESVLIRAVSGSHSDIEFILKMYAPLIDRSSYFRGKLDEDLRQYILIHVVKNIAKFKI